MENRTQEPDSRRSVLYALAANLAIAAAKTAGALYTGSGSLLAEALHSGADCGNQALLLWGMHRQDKPPSPDYPLGHGPEIFFWSFVVAVLLFSVGGLVSIYEGVHKLESSEPIHQPWVAIAILVFGLVAEGVSLRAALHEISKVRGGLSLWAWFKATRRSELLVVASEDTAAMFGLAFALAAIGTSVATGDPVYDAVGSIAIGVLLVCVALVLAAEVKGLLIGQSAAPRARAGMRELLETHPHVRRVAGFVTLQHGPHVLVAARLGFDEDLADARMVRIIADCRQRMHEAYPQVTWVYLEPVAGAVETR